MIDYSQTLFLSEVHWIHIFGGLCQLHSFSWHVRSMIWSLLCQVPFFQTDKDPSLGCEIDEAIIFPKVLCLWHVSGLSCAEKPFHLEEVRTAGCNFPGLWCSGKSCGQVLCWWCNLASKSDHKSTIESTDRWFYWVALVQLVFNCNSVVFLNSKS